MTRHNERKNCSAVLGREPGPEGIYESALALTVTIWESDQRPMGTTVVPVPCAIGAIKAETSGIKALQDFAITLRTYLAGCNPAPNLAYIY